MNTDSNTSSPTFTATVPTLGDALVFGDKHELCFVRITLPGGDVREFQPGTFRQASIAGSWTYRYEEGILCEAFSVADHEPVTVKDATPGYNDGADCFAIPAPPAENPLAELRETASQFPTGNDPTVLWLLECFGTPENLLASYLPSPADFHDAQVSEWQECGNVGTYDPEVAHAFITSFTEPDTYTVWVDGFEVWAGTSKTDALARFNLLCRVIAAVPVEWTCTDGTADCSAAPR